MVADASEAAGVVVGGGAAPDDVVEEIVGAEDGVHDGAEVVDGGVVAVEVDAAGVFEGAVEFEESDAHEG